MAREWIFAFMFIVALCCVANAQQVTCEATQFGTVGPIPWDTQPAAGVWCMVSHPGARVFAVTVEYEVNGASQKVKALVEANEQGSAMWPFVLATHVGAFRYIGASAIAYVEQSATAEVQRPRTLAELAKRRHNVCITAYDSLSRLCMETQIEWLKAGNEALRDLR